MREIPYKDDYIIIEERKNKSKAIFWLFFGIIGFIAIYLPFYGANLRYQTGNLLSGFFNTVGTILVTIGILMMVWGILTLFCGSKGGALKLLLLGFLFLFIGSYFLSPVVIGAISSGKDVPQGYH